MSRSRQKEMNFGLSSLFTLTLILSILCHAYLPSYAQNASSSPRETLIEDIEADVARRLEAGGDLLSPDQIKELYLTDAEAAGLTYRELVALYEQEYVEQKAAKKPSPWQQFQPGVGWLVGLASLGALAYTTLLKKWIETQLKTINDWIYRKGAGTRLFRSLALRKYRAALVANNQTLPMPFIKNHEPLQMQDVYVPLKVSAPRDEQQRIAANTDIPKQKQIDAYQAVTDYRRLMVIGAPGSGKSILLKYLAWASGLGQLTTLKDQPTVVLLELYRLSDSELNEEKLIQAIVDALDRNDFPNAQNFVRNGLKEGIFLLLLDGLDEVNSEVRTHVVSVLRDLLKGKWKQCRAVITCRTAVYEGEFSDVAERKLEVVEFTDQQMRRFLKAWEPDMVRARKSVNQMMATLRERPLILELARNPLLLTLVAYLYIEPAFVLPRSRAEFYKESVSILLEQRKFKGDDDYQYNRYEANEKHRVLQHLALYAQDNSAQLKDRRSIQAAIIREQIKAVLPGLDIKEEETKDILEEIVERSGLLMKIDGGDRYLFPHLTLQEYFAATALKEQEQALIQRFTADTKAWREVVKLWCSLANESTAFVRTIYNKDPLTGFECLAEARQVDPELAQSIIDHFKPQLDTPQTDDILTRAFGSVAANDRGRGKALFSFLEQTLLDPQSPPLRQTAAAYALSKTNLSKAAEVLTGWYGNNDPIIKMGDLAVPSLSILAAQGALQPLADLCTIGTPNATTALVPLLWSEKVSVSQRAAWYLGGLLSQAGIEEELNEYELSAYQKQSETLSWIWQPLNKTSNRADTSSIEVITGRIAYLLQQNNTESIIKSVAQQVSRLEPRLVIPLCTLQLQPAPLPKSLPTQTESLLEQTDNSSPVETACSLIVKGALSQQPESKTQWVRLLSTLPPKVQLDLLSRLIQHEHPTRNHWRTLDQVVNYNLRESWHYRTVLTIAALLSIVAIAQICFTAFVNAESVLVWFSVGPVILITVIFWATVRRGVESPLEPSLFWELGPWGVPNFAYQLTQLLQKKIVWSGVEPLFKSVTDSRTSDITFAVAFVSAFAVAFAGAGAGAFAGAFAGAGAVAFAVAGAGAFAVAVAVALAVAVAFAVA
ncbi:MAG: NACHT domain-containing protein, partial [Cyanobacteria bacterium J06650_10]